MYEEDFMNNILDWKEYSRAARNAAAEGCVLLRNEKQALPIRPGETVSVFGRIQPQQLLNLLIRILIRDKLNPVNPD